MYGSGRIAVGVMIIIQGKTVNIAPAEAAAGSALRTAPVRRIVTSTRQATATTMLGSASSGLNSRFLPFVFLTFVP